MSLARAVGEEAAGEKAVGVVTGPEVGPTALAMATGEGPGSIARIVVRSASRIVNRSATSASRNVSRSGRSASRSGSRSGRRSGRIAEKDPSSARSTCSPLRERHLYRPESRVGDRVRASVPPRFSV